jgi:phosphomannomutase
MLLAARWLAMEFPEIKFGTDGWRGVIADDFTFDNVALVSAAIHAYLNESGQAGKPLLIGYDRRFAAERLAAHIAVQLQDLGQDVVMVAEPSPTPVVAFGVRHIGAAGAIMLTASHNPFYYQGLKFIPYFAGPAMPETTDRITQLIRELGPAFAPRPLALKFKGQRVELREAYFTQLDTLVNAHCLTSNSWKVLYDPMHGLGAGFLDGYLQRCGVPVVTVHGERDVYFGDCLPDPSPQNLAPLVPRLAETGCQVLIGTDGDADRFGFMDPEGRYFGANQALPMLADYLVRYKRMQGSLVRTVSTSHLLDEVAREHGLLLIETAVGFKYVGDRLQHGGLIGGEESGGVSIQGHVPEKDGILASLLMLELAATMGGDFHSLYTDLQRRLGARAFIRVDQELHTAEKERLLAALRSYHEPKFAGKKIASRNDMDGVKFIFEDGGWVLMRASGTEPVVRIYIEVTNPDGLSRFKAAVLEQVQALSAG